MSASREKNKRKEQIASGETPAAPEKKGMSKGLKWTIGIICLVLVIAIVTFFSHADQRLSGPSLDRGDCRRTQADPRHGELFL